MKGQEINNSIKWNSHIVGYCNFFKFKKSIFGAHVIQRPEPNNPAGPSLRVVVDD
jgi:hypothetical protein